MLGLPPASLTALGLRQRAQNFRFGVCVRSVSGDVLENHRYPPSSFDACGQIEPWPILGLK